MNKPVFLMIVLTLMTLVLGTTACEKDNDTKPTDDARLIPDNTGKPIESAERVEIIIGNLSDQTGVGATAMAIIDQFLCF